MPNLPSIPAEEWKPIVSAPGYWVSSMGRFKNRQGRVLSGTMSWTGYRHIGLLVGGKQKWFLAHRLVAEAFLSNPEAKPVVNHLDRDRTNNAAGNLQWATLSENSAHATKRTKEKMRRFSGLFVCGLLYC